MFFILGTMLYLTVAGYWGGFAAEVNSKITNDKRMSVWFGCYITNVILCPLAVLVAYIKLLMGKYDIYLVKNDDVNKNE